MWRPGNRPGLAVMVAFATATVPAMAQAQSIVALPEQTSRLRLSNRDVNHIVCNGGEIEDVRFSAEKGIAVERGGSDAWIKFLVLETDDLGARTRTYATAPAEFFVACNGAIYPLYAEPSDIAAQTVVLVPGATQRASANKALLAPMVEEERAVGITLALLQDRVPASFSPVAPANRDITVSASPRVTLSERQRLEVEGAGLSVSEYLVRAEATTPLDERDFLDSALGDDIFAITLDRLIAGGAETARLIAVRRSARP